MCLAVPGKVLEINENKGKVDISGMKLDVMFNLLEDVKVDDYVIVHAGFAIEKLSEKEAEETFKLLEDLEIIVEDESLEVTAEE